MVTQEQLAQAILELKSSQEKTDEQMKRTDERLNKVAKLVGNISNNQGGVAEEFFINSIATTQKLGGIQYDFMETNAHRHIKSQNLRDEFDILLVNGKDIAIVEVKYKAHSKDIEKLINKKYTNFKKLYPEYKDYNHHLGLASFFISNETKEKALNSNVMILQRKGEIIEAILPSSSF